MKVPKQTKRYCPYCKKHTQQKIMRTKTKPRPKTKKHALKWGVRHMSEVLAGYGGFPRPKIHEKSKQSTKASFTYLCTACSKKHVLQNPKRAKRVEQI